jgi:hypothetical protein
MKNIRNVYTSLEIFFKEDVKLLIKEVHEVSEKSQCGTITFNVF